MDSVGNRIKCSLMSLLLNNGTIRHFAINSNSNFIYFFLKKMSFTVPKLDYDLVKSVTWQSQQKKLRWRKHSISSSEKVGFESGVMTRLRKSFGFIWKYIVTLVLFNFFFLLLIPCSSSFLFFYELQFINCIFFSSIKPHSKLSLSYLNHFFFLIGFHIKNFFSRTRQKNKT